MKYVNLHTTKFNVEKKRRIIDIVIRLFIHIMKSGKEISSQEIDILYFMIIDLFKQLDVSWEVYIRTIKESEFDYKNAADFLNLHLNEIDKIRIVTTLIIMTHNESDYDLQQITTILELCRNLGLNSDGIMKIVNELEIKTNDIVFINYNQPYNQIFNSIFSDYVFFGRSHDSDVRFRNLSLSYSEFCLFVIDRFLFIVTNNDSNIMLNGLKLNGNSIYLLPRDSKLSIGDVLFDRSILWKLYEGRERNDEITFKKTDYHIVFKVSCNKYTMRIYFGVVYLNGKVMQINKDYQICYDDILQIKGYSPFRLQDIIVERSRIGVDNIVPNELYINYENDYYYISRKETSHSFAYIEVTDNQLYLYPPKKGWEVYLNEIKVSEPIPFRLNTDTITVNQHHFKINYFYDLIEIPFEIGRISIFDLKYFFKNGQIGLDSISFEIQKGQFIGIMGPSGCGKSTLVKALNAEIIPHYGKILIDGKNFYTNTTYFTQHFGYVPQDDLLYPYLTVYENLFFRGRLRMPKISKSYLNFKIDNILQQTNLLHKKNTLVGTHNNKFLSGGERKRLNIALELLFEPTVIICDEPTSGLSFSDSENIIAMLKSISEQGKIVIITIHQPSVNTFNKFNQIVLLDMMGKQVYWGRPQDVYSYFDEELNQITINKNEIFQKKQSQSPDFIYDVIMYPLYSENGEVIYEHINGIAAVKRKFPPEYWRDKFKRKTLFELIKHHEAYPIEEKAYIPKEKKQAPKYSYIQLINFTMRNFKMKIRNNTNTIITFIQSPLLGFIIGFILRFSPNNDQYTYHNNINIGIYIFVSIIIFIFMGLANSIGEVYEERKIVIREKLMNLKMRYYLLSKIFVLLFFSVLQVVIYFSISSLILEIRGSTASSIGYFILSSIIGFSLGLMVSSLIKDSKSIINILPLILIPQIIFGGAIIEYERMNKNLKIMPRNPLPEIVQLIPTRWLFEGLVASYGKNNVYQSKLQKIEKKRLTLESQYKNNIITYAEYINVMDEFYRLKSQIAERWPEERYSNAYLSLTVNLMDGRFFNTHRNVFLSSYKHVAKWIVRTWSYNLLIILLYVMAINLITIIILRYHFT